jgi:hypothetical protein
MVGKEMTKISDITTKCVAIVRFGPSGLPTDGIKAGEYFQVTIDPDQCSPSGEFIRFGPSPGDEIVGWQRCEALCVVEVLGEWDGDTPPLMRYGSMSGITQVT